MGANTYIGNAPNLMVKAIAEDRGVTMPSFFGYMAWSVRDPGAAVRRHDLHLVLTETGASHDKPQILVARAIFPETIARLREHFDVEPTTRPTRSGARPN